MTIKITISQSDFTFTLYPIDTKFNRIAGIYIFVITLPATENQQPSTPYNLLYVGITNNFRGRFNQHHKIARAISLGMTHIGILKISSGRKRKKIERNLLKNYNPPLNQTWLYD